MDLAFSLWQELELLPPSSKIYHRIMSITQKHEIAWIWGSNEKNCENQPWNV